MRRVSVSLLFLLPLTMSCATYYTTRTRGPETVLTFDRTLPEALDEVLAKCHDPLSINPSQPLALSGDCVPADLSTDAKALWVPLEAQKPLDLSGIFSAALGQKLHAEYAIDKIDHCLINFRIDMDLVGFDLNAAEAKWITYNGTPAFAIDFEPANDPSRLATGTLNSSVECEKGYENLELQIATRLPQGDNAIALCGIDFDVRFKFSASGRNVVVGAQSDFTVDCINLDPPMGELAESFVGTFEEIIKEYAGITREQLQEGVNNGVELALSRSNFPERMEQLVEDGIPAGDQICSIKVRNGKLKITTDGRCALKPTVP